MSLVDPNFFQRHKIAISIGGVILLLFIIGLFFAYCSNQIDKKEKELQSNIDQQKGVNAVIVNQITNQQEVVNNASNNTNQAVNDFRDSVNRDSNSFSGSSTDRFCSRFPCDSTCVEWRRSRGIECK